MITAGSGEVLNVVGTTFLLDGKKVLGVEPSYNSVYSHATNIKTEAIKLPLTKDYRQDMGVIIDTAKKRASEIGFVYICNPNNPTGVIVTKQEIKQLLDESAGRHARADRRGVSPLRRRSELRDRDAVRQRRPSGHRRAHVLEDRRDGGAAPRLRRGDARDPRRRCARSRPAASTCSRSTAASPRSRTRRRWRTPRARRSPCREKTAKDLKALGYDVIPSQANFFMVGLRREVQPVIQAFREEGVLVGRPVPADDAASARLGRHAGGNGPLHGRLQEGHGRADDNSEPRSSSGIEPRTIARKGRLAPVLCPFALIAGRRDSRPTLPLPGASASPSPSIAQTHRRADRLHAIAPIPVLGPVAGMPTARWSADLLASPSLRV